MIQALNLHKKIKDLQFRHPHKTLKFVNFRKLVVVYCLLTGCTNQKPASGEELAKSYCGSCHGYADPSLLDKATWRTNVLPAMSTRLGLSLFFDEYYQDVKKDSGDLSISLEEWKKILEFYEKEAPETQPPQERERISKITSRFEPQAPVIDNSTFPSATYVKIDRGNKWIYAANALDSSLLIFNQSLKQIARIPSSGIIVDIDFQNDLSKPGDRSGILTNIGIINPNDIRTGSGTIFQINSKGKILRQTKIMDNLPRPVQILHTDLDNDNITDYLVCGFGNQQGVMSWITPTTDGKFRETIILNEPGAIKAYVEDVNNDSLEDIWALFAQGRESIYLFINKGNGKFDKITILDFPPVYGSTYFEFADFNKDGRKDILFTCGDNADLTSKNLKNYHGVYIFLNRGNNQFTKDYFFPINGCYKAVARDYDLDGDIDIAAVAFFADYENQPQESFVYLENSGNGKFSPFTIRNYDAGKWITMDVGDIDGDGDEDVVIGSLAPETDIKPTSGSQSKVLFLLLKNQTR